MDFTLSQVIQFLVIEGSILAGFFKLRSDLAVESARRLALESRVTRDEDHHEKNYDELKKVIQDRFDKLELKLDSKADK